MKWKIQMYVGGKVFSDYCYASNRKESLLTAKARNPFARIIATNPEVS